MLRRGASLITQHYNFLVEILDCGIVICNKLRAIFYLKVHIHT